MEETADSFAVSFGESRVEVAFPSEFLLEAAQKVFRHMVVEPGSRGPVAASYRVKNSVLPHEVVDGSGAKVATAHSVSELQQVLKSEVSLDLIRSNPGFLWLHASGATIGGKAILLTGISGRGKSTLVSGLCQRGWKYLGDDMLPLELETRRVLPFPATALRRIPEESGKFLPPDRFDRLKRTWINMSPETVSMEPAPVGGIILPEFRLDGTHTLEPAAGSCAATALLSGCINFIEHDRDAVHHLCALIESVPVHHLGWCDPERAVNTIVGVHG